MNKERVRTKEAFFLAAVRMDDLKIEAVAEVPASDIAEIFGGSEGAEIYAKQQVTADPSELFERRVSLADPPRLSHDTIEFARGLMRHQYVVCSYGLEPTAIPRARLAATKRLVDNFYASALLRSA